MTIAKQSRTRRGIRAREIVVTAALLGLLGMAGIIWLNHQRVRSRRQFCEMRQIQLVHAMWGYEQLGGHFPGYRNHQAIDAAGESVATGWVFPVLPYISSMPGDFQVEQSERWFHELRSNEERDEIPLGPHADVHREYGPTAEEATRGAMPSLRLPELICPANRPREDEPTWMSYVVNSGMPDAAASADVPADWRANGVFMDRFPVGKAISLPVDLAYVEKHNGLGHTLLFSENVDSGLWTDSDEPLVGFVWVANLVDDKPDPGDKLLRVNQRIGEGDASHLFARPSSWHPGGVNVAFCSGRTMFLSEDVDYLAYTRMLMSDSSNIRYAGTMEFVKSPYRRD